MKMKIALALASVTAMSACSSFDVPLSHPKSENVGVWVSPEGCESWYFIEGTGAFMAPREKSNCRVVCDAPPMPPQADAAPSG